MCSKKNVLIHVNNDEKEQHLNNCSTRSGTAKHATAKICPLSSGIGMKRLWGVRTVGHEC